MNATLHWSTGVFIVGLLLSTMPMSSRADWPTTGAPVAPASNAGQHPFTMATDGTGGIFVSWSESWLFASHLSSEGDVVPGWPDHGRRVGGSSYFNLATLPDRAGGVYVVFNAKDCTAHCGPDPSERRVIRLTADGALSPGWTDFGVPVGGGWGPVGFGAGDAGQTAAIPDGEGGVIVAWGRHVGPNRLSAVELRIQRMDGAGTRLWGDSGRVVRSATYPFPRHAVAPDGRGGALMFWLDARAPGLYAQRVSPDGEPMWNENGIPLGRDSLLAFTRPVVIEDGSRGAIVAWFGAAKQDTGVFALRVTSGGGLPWQEPMRVLSASSGIDWLHLVPTRSGDALLAWRDSRTPGNESIHAQRVSRGGHLEWGPDGVVVSAAPSHKNYLSVASDDEDGAYLAWGDTRPAGEVFATHLDRSGQPVAGWDTDGTPICTRVADLWQVRLVSDEMGNAVVAWSDSRILTPGIPRRATQAMRLLPNGPVAQGIHALTATPKRPARQSALGGIHDLGLALHGVSPNPGARAAFVHFALPDAGESVLELFDVSGRRIWSRDVGGLGAGEHAVRLADGAWLPRGIYMVRLTRGVEARAARVAIIW